MKTYTMLNASGVPIRTGNALEVPEGCVEFPADIPVVDLYSLMLVEGSWVERPTIFPPFYPDGSVVDVYGADRVFLGVYTTPCAFPEGAVFLDITPPMPYMRMTVNIGE